MSRKTKQAKRQRKNRRLSRLLPVGVAIAVSLAVFVWVLPGINESGSTASRQAALVTGTLQAPQTFHDFGRISMGDGKVSHRFLVRNSSGSPARIERLYTS